MTPDDTSFTGLDCDDRPNAQYAAAGVYFRTIARPKVMTPGLVVQIEDRIGVEIGWQSVSLPLFDIQNALHGLSETSGNRGNGSNGIDGELPVNLEAKRSWRFHVGGTERDLEFAPFIQTSLGMRENSFRVGGDVFIGAALEGRIWGADLATGAVMAGASLPRERLNYTCFADGDVGYIASDAFLDDDFAGNGPSVERRDFFARARAGVLLEFDKFGF